MRMGEIQPTVLRVQDLEKIKEVQRQTPDVIRRQFEIYFKQVTENRQKEVNTFKESNKSKDVMDNERNRRNYTPLHRESNKEDSDGEEVHQPGLGENIDIRV
ncbi:MAG: hypothetical protein ACP5RW_01940 [bacterium]